MKIDLLLDNVQQIKSSRLDDVVDRLCYVWTSLILVFFVFVTGMQSTFSEALQCMLPKNFAGTWQAYANTYCYIEGTFHTNSGTDVQIYDSDKYVNVQYYQWIPYTLALQSLSFAAPHFFYLALAAFSYSGFNFKQVVNRCVDVSSKESEKLEKEVKDVARGIYDYTSLPDTKKKLRSLGRSLTLSYLLEKVLNVVVIIANIYFLNKFIGEGKPGWAFSVVNQALEGRYWDATGVFPRVTYCNIELTTLGQSQVHAVQCLLMLNVLIEKIYVVIYFWLMFLLVVTIGNLIWIVYEWLDKNESEVYKYAEPYFKEDEDNFDDFIRYVADDGRLLVRFVHEHAGRRVAAQLVEKLIEFWREKKSEKGATDLVGITVDTNPKTDAVDDNPKTDKLDIGLNMHFDADA